MSTGARVSTVLPSYIVCPSCKSAMDNIDLNLICAGCTSSYPIRNGVPLLVEEIRSILSQENNVHPDKERQIAFYTKVGEYLQQVSSRLGYTESLNYLNFGYVANENREYSPINLPDRLVNRTSIKLTLEVIGNIDLDQKTVLEVGCGRGGNLISMQQYYQPYKLIGLDLCQYSINYCRQNHSDQIDFWVGDAEALPFSDGLADVVFNLESSHAYPNKEQFYKEVFRVLKPGGFFLYSDSLPSSAYFAIENYLQELGFELLFRQDITANVLLSCDRIAATREMALSNIINKEEQKALSDFVATPDSEVYQNMSSGKWLYKILRLQKVA